jgi:hypothetical protein
MATNNSSNQQFTDNTDGFSIGGGTTSRSLSVTSGNVSVTGGGSNTYYFPINSDTLMGLASTDTVTGVKTFTSKINAAASTTTAASLNIPAGTAPTTPLAGDIYYANSHLYAYIGSTAFPLDVVSLSTQVTGTLPIANGGTGSVTQNFVDLSSSQTIAGVKTFSSPIAGSVTKRVVSLTAVSSTYTPNISTTDISLINSPSANFTIANPTGTPTDGQQLTFRIASGSTGYTPTWGTAYLSSGAASLPSASLPASKTITLNFTYDASRAIWVLLTSDSVGY